MIENHFQELQALKIKYEQAETARLIAEQKLKESEAQYQHLIEAGTALIWISGTDKLCYFFNNNWLQFTGRRLEQEIGNGWAEGVHPEDFDRCLDTYISSFDKRKAFEMEYRLRHASGEYKWLLDIGTPNYNSTGDFIGYIGHCFDITERKKTELALKHSEEKYRNIFESVQDIYYEASLDGILLEISPSIEKIAKGLFKREEVIGLNIVSVYANPKERELFFAKLSEQGRVNDYELLLLNKDGSTIPVAISSALVFDDKGIPQKITGIIRDITDRKIADFALQETLDLLKEANRHLEQRVEERTKELNKLLSMHEAILQHAGLAIISTSTDGIIEHFNRAAEEMLGYKANEVIGKLKPSIFHVHEELQNRAKEMSLDKEENAPLDLKFIQQTLHKSNNRTEEWTYIHKNGRKFPVNLTLSSIFNAEGNVIGYIGIAIDITKEKQAIADFLESESKYRYLFENMVSGFQLSEVFVDENNLPIDFNFIDGNKNMKKFIGYDIEEIRGKTIRQILPDADINMIRKYGNVALTGEHFTMEYLSKTFNRYFHVTCYCPKKGFFVAIFDDISERKLMEKALQESEAENRAIIQAVPDLMLRVNRDGIFLNVISQNESLLFVPQEAFIGKSVNDILPPELAKLSMQVIEKAFVDGNIEQFEYTLPVQNNFRYYENRIIAISNEEALSIIRDITERKLAENALSESESRFSQFMDYLPAVAFLKDHESKMLYLNKYAEKYFEKNKWLGKNMIDVFPNNLGKRITLDDKKTLKKGYLKFDESVVDINGDVHDFETHKFTIIRNGKEPLIGGIGIDVSIRKKAELEILNAKNNLEKQVSLRTAELVIAKEIAEKNEEKFKHIFNSGNDPMFVRQLDKDGNFSILIDVNEVACEKYGYEKEEFLTLLPNKIVDPIIFSKYDLPALKELIDKRKVTFETIHLTKDGREMNVELSARFFELQGENVVLSIVRDITQRKNAEKAVIESQRLMAIGEMASSVAHDFNNSLQAMLGYIEIIKFKGNIDSSTHGYINTIETLLTDVSSRVNLLQRFGDKKQNTNNFIQVNINALISEVILQLRPLWKDNLEKAGKHIQIETTFCENLFVLCNEGEIKTAFHNILKNSIEAMPEGGNLSISTKLESNEAYITFTDTGIGMNEETKTKIFQPFYTTKGYEAGRGLGMSGVYSVVKSCGGNIYVVSSEIGKGTTIEIAFPINNQLENKIDKMNYEQQNDSDGKLKILWVEDDDIIRTSIIELVNLIGHDCETATNGKEALELLDKKSYDIVLTDIGMAEMTGWQLADAIKEKFSGKMKVGVVSGWQVTDAEKQEHGVQYSLSKPFTIASLNKLLFSLKN